MTEGRVDLLNLAEVQEKYKKGDIDNLLNELHDSMVGYYLGFQYVNIDKHGFDCKYDQDTGIFLESKVASFTASTWSATFNDTNMEKVQAFKEKKCGYHYLSGKIPQIYCLSAMGNIKGLESFWRKKSNLF